MIASKPIEPARLAVSESLVTPSTCWWPARPTSAPAISITSVYTFAMLMPAVAGRVGVLADRAELEAEGAPLEQPPDPDGREHASTKPVWVAEDRRGMGAARRPGATAGCRSPGRWKASLVSRNSRSRWPT